MTDLNHINGMAQPEGWAIFEADGGLQLQGCDAPEDGSDPRFDDDSHAWEYVCRKALEGSDLHQAALLYLKGSESGHEEWKRINKHAVVAGLIPHGKEVV